MAASLNDTQQASVYNRLGWDVFDTYPILTDANQINDGRLMPTKTTTVLEKPGAAPAPDATKLER